MASNHSPSQLEGKRRARIAGRLLDVRENCWVIADALVSVTVRFEDSSASIGDLVVVLAERRGKRWFGRRLVARDPAPEPRGDGEWAHLTRDGRARRLLMRSRALAAIRRLFAQLGFLEVETPVRVKTPGLDLHVDALKAEGGYLVTSPEHHLKRLLAGGLPRLFRLGPCFRAGEQGPWHEPEFTMLEWYRAFAGQSEVMRDTERVVAAVAEATVGARRLTLWDGRHIDVTSPFDRLTVREAFREFARIADACDLAESDEDRFFELLVSRVEPALARHPRPVFLCDYPIAQASLARARPDDPRVAERFELYLGGVELCNGFGELTDAREQRRRFRRDRRARAALRRPVYAIDRRLLAALEEGMPPAGGNALGVDRLIALCLGRGCIQDVLCFSDESR